MTIKSTFTTGLLPSKTWSRPQPLGLRRLVSSSAPGCLAPQVDDLGITHTPHHPETELRKLGADFESVTRFRDPLANHWVVDGNLVTGQNQNAGPMVAREMLRLAARIDRPSSNEVIPGRP